MTGPEHYREAERLLTEAGDLQTDAEDVNALPLLARAQVHATLALAAASVRVGVHGSVSPGASGWVETLGTGVRTR